MEAVPQEPQFHAEGDVLVHTRLVAEALVTQETWRTLGESDRHILFAAALLHDVGKPACTKVAPDGSVTSKNHARRGEVRSRRILWVEAGSDAAPFEVRETVCGLVRAHGLPLWFIEKEAPQRRRLQVSLSVRLDQVALLAEADARGRVCADQPELLRRIELFRE